MRAFCVWLIGVLWVRSLIQMMNYLLRIDEDQPQTSETADCNVVIVLPVWKHVVSKIEHHAWKRPQTRHKSTFLWRWNCRRTIVFQVHQFLLELNPESHSPENVLLGHIRSFELGITEGAQGHRQSSISDHWCVIDHVIIEKYSEFVIKWVIPSDLQLWVQKQIWCWVFIACSKQVWSQAKFLCFTAISKILNLRKNLSRTKVMKTAC